MILDENYFQVQGFMINRLGLKGYSLMVYAIIYGFSQDGESEFTGSRQYLCDFTGCTKPTIDKALNELIEKNLIVKSTEIRNGVSFNRYKINLVNFTSGKETLLGGKETLHNNNSNNIDKEILSKDSKESNEISEVIEYLNTTCYRRFKTSSQSIRKLIKARLNEGYTVDDMKKVIDLKAKQWKNTRLDIYLRPDTLFNATKFANYYGECSTSEVVETYGTRV